MTVNIPYSGTGQSILSYFVITTATAALLTGGSIDFNSSSADSLRLKSGKSIFSDLKDYEIALRGFNSSGSYAGLSDYPQEISVIIGFAEKMLAEMSDIPVEFEKIFQENFRDILA